MRGARNKISRKRVREGIIEGPKVRGSTLGSVKNTGSILTFSCNQQGPRSNLLGRW